MLQALASIGRTLTNIGKAVLGFFEDLATLLDIVIDALTEIPYLLTQFLPSTYVSLFVTAFAVSVIYKVLGRD